MELFNICGMESRDIINDESGPGPRVNSGVSLEMAFKLVKILFKIG